jgi:hypothetical protein
MLRLDILGITAAVLFLLWLLGWEREIYLDTTNKEKPYKRRWRWNNAE